MGGPRRGCGGSALWRAWSGRGAFTFVGGELGLECCQGLELVVELGLQGEGLALARQIVGEPALVLRAMAPLLEQLDVEPAQLMLEPGDQAQGCEPGLEVDLLRVAGALQGELHRSGPAGGRGRSSRRPP